MLSNTLKILWILTIISVFALAAAVYTNSQNGRYQSFAEGALLLDSHAGTVYNIIANDNLKYSGLVTIRDMEKKRKEYENRWKIIDAIPDKSETQPKDRK